MCFYDTIVIKEGTKEDTIRQKIGTRLIGGFLIGAAITVLVGAVAMFALVRVNNTANDLISTDIKSVNRIHDFIEGLSIAYRYEKDFLHSTEIGNHAEQEESAAKLESAWKALVQNAEDVRQTSRLCLRCHGVTKQAPPDIGHAIEERGNRIVQLMSLSREIQRELTALMLAGKTYEEVQPQYLEYRESVQQLEDLTAGLHHDTVHMIEIREQELIQTQGTFRNLVVGTVAAAVILALFLGITLTRSITRPVSRLSEVTKRIDAGDLDQRAEVTSEDELGELATSFNRMTESLQKSRDEIKEKNQELEATNEELGAAGEELKRMQEQLIRSERLAAIGQLAGGVGHELRNPLGAIKNAAYYIKGKVAKSELGQKEPRVMEFLDIMDDEINSSNKIINDLLGFSRVGKPSVSPTRIEKVIEDTLSRLAIPENIELTKKLDADLPEVKIDSDQIQQVLMNVTTNAVEAMPDGGKLTIGAREEDKFLEVKIADTGCGISQEVMDKIFEPLFTTKAKGIGLGLALCKAIVDRHEGNIEVKSEVGKGTTFTIKLPLKAE